MVYKYRPTLMMTRHGSKWLFHLPLLLLSLSLVSLLSNKVAAKGTHGGRSKPMTPMMLDWTHPKYKKVLVPADADRDFCSSDNIAPRFDSPAVRKEIHTLSTEELTRFHDVLTSMKLDPSYGVSGIPRYDMFVYNHRSVSAPGAHGGPAFFCFHREYLKRFEQSMRDCDPKAFLPYWDSSLEASLPDPSQSALFTDEYLGASFGIVNTGFMANWKVVPEDCQEMGMEVTRECGNDGSLLMTEDKVDHLVQRKSFTETCTPYDTTLEDDHGKVHAYLGGHMMSLACAPNDPIFFLHHAFIDCCYERFRQLHPGSDNPKVYPDDDDVPQYHRKNDAMRPFYEMKNVDGLSKDYTRSHYVYENRTNKCSVDADCKSRILCCDKVRERCMAKVRETGDCTGLPSGACYCPGSDQTPQCVTVDGTGRCKCNKGNSKAKAPKQESQWAPCKSCKPGEWCDSRVVKCQKCKFEGSECSSAAAWCSTAKKQCRTFEIGEKCQGFPDEACKGTCDEDAQVIICQDTCLCVSPE